MMDDLITWLRAQIDDDEKYASAAIEEGERLGVTWPEAWGPNGADMRIRQLHIARHDPDRVLREVKTKRQIIDLFEAARAFAFRPDSPASGAALALGDAVASLALPFSDRPGYQEEWAV
jgi:hypothetical protein